MEENDTARSENKSDSEHDVAEQLRFSPYTPNEQRSRPVVSANFENALLNILDNLPQHQSSVLVEDSRCVVIYDGFPKARLTELSESERLIAFKVPRACPAEGEDHVHTRPQEERPRSFEVKSLTAACISRRDTQTHAPSCRQANTASSSSARLMRDVDRDGRVSINKEAALYEYKGITDSSLTARSQWLKDDMISHRTEEVLEETLCSTCADPDSQKVKNIPALKEHLAK
eukprot:760003-Hanusia_phi.AAC.1